MELSFYPGCTAHSTGIEYNASLHAAFEALDVELKEIDDWNCCGGAAAHSLSGKLGVALPARNIKQAQQSDLPLAISCAGCFNAVKTADYCLAHDSQAREELEATLDFTYSGDLQIKALHEVLIDMVGLEALRAKVSKPLAGLKVASYYGCALVRSPEVVEMGDPENPLFLDEIVTALGGEAVQWSYKVDCCGSDMALTHGKIATELADRVVGGARDAGANCLSSACGLCQINIDMRQSVDPRIPVFYFTELMGVALDVPARRKWWPKHIVDPIPLLQSADLI